MKVSDMKMTVTLTKADVDEIVRKEIASRFAIGYDRMGESSFKIKSQHHGDMRDSWQTHDFESVTIEISGDAPRPSTFSQR